MPDGQVPASHPVLLADEQRSIEHESIPEHEPYAVDLSALQQLKQIVPQLARHRVVFVGETHDRYDHHLSQLELLRRLHAVKPDLAIGVEWFQQPFQAYLDDFIAGRISAVEMLEQTEYYQRWRFDYRLYRPILEYAHTHRIPVIALNVPAELTRKVGREGLEALSKEERTQLPSEIDRSDEAYAQRLRTVFEQHPTEGRSFENFVTVQLLWDEGMAERAAQFLTANPATSLVIFAGSGHLAYGSGIPNRLARRTGVRYPIVLSDSELPLAPEIADFWLVSKAQKLKSPGRLGAYLKSGSEGVIVEAFSARSGAREAGLAQGDRVVRIEGQPVDTYTDVKWILMGYSSGQSIHVEVVRDSWLFGPQEKSYQVRLR